MHSHITDKRGQASATFYRIFHKIFSKKIHSYTVYPTKYYKYTLLYYMMDMGLLSDEYSFCVSHYEFLL